LGSIVDPGQRLEGEALGVVSRLVIGPADGHGRGARRAVLVEDDNPRIRVPEELEREGAKEGALSSACRSDDEGVSDVLDGQVETERRVPAGAAVEVR